MIYGKVFGVRNLCLNPVLCFWHLTGGDELERFFQTADTARHRIAHTGARRPTLDRRFSVIDGGNGRESQTVGAECHGKHFIGTCRVDPFLHFDLSA